MEIRDFNLRHLAAVTAVRALGTVSGAARTVHLTQPAITQGIAKLERALGMPLFLRRPDGMEPTEACSLLAARAEVALRLIASRRTSMTQIRAFLAFASGGTYASAAAATGLSEASLHRAVSDLSAAYGGTLLDRRGRRLILTRKGQAIARSLRLAVVELEAALVDIAALAGREIGRITIGAMPLARARLLPDVIARFHAEHPGTDLAVIEGSHAELVDPLRDGRVDIVVGALRQESAAEFVTEPLFRDIPLIVGRAGHPLKNLSGAIDGKRLLSYPWIVPGKSTPLRTLWRRMFEQLGEKAPHVAIECGSGLMIRQILIASDHLTLLSADQISVELEAGWLRSFGPAPGDLGRTIGATIRADWRPTVRQQRFFQLLREGGDSFETSIRIK